MVTLSGIVVTDLKQGEVRGRTVASFRFLSTVRRYERLRGGWHDAELNFVTVTCWRGLALNVVASVEKGDPLIVFGRLKVRSWDTADRGGSTVEIDAYAVGHDLNRGTSAFKRNKEAEAVEKDDTIEETARKVRSDAEEEGLLAEKAILEARRAVSVDAAAIVANGVAGEASTTQVSADERGAGGQAPAVAPPSQPDKPSTVEGPDPEPAEPGQPDTEPDGLKRDGKRTIFNVSRSKEREPAGV